MKKLITTIVLLVFNLNGFSQDINFMEMSLEELLNLKVESASKLKEPLEETPVPVTIITRDMIVNSGAKNLKICWFYMYQDLLFLKTTMK
ncbi:MAG TPA: hypothetical protein PLI27_02825 [Ignavibacteriales bacterium]|nr:hypothetical protein [Ignavibacteriales bacterium]HRR18842.1 hypothetical protein [Ignavibacteriales bacterium]HRT98417.1 hypothetical protein [Ignavibacteriales bacterium]